MRADPNLELGLWVQLGLREKDKVVSTTSLFNIVVTYQRPTRGTDLPLSDLATKNCTFSLNTNA
jgi:hypothetical protein